MFNFFVEFVNFAFLRYFLSNKANSNNRKDYGNAPHIIAAFNVQNVEKDYESNLQIARKLFNFEANADQMNDLYNTFMHFAASHRYDDMTDILLQIQIRQNSINSGLQYSIDYCALLKKRPPYTCTDWITVKQFSQCHPDIYRTNNMKEISVMWTVKAGDIRIFHELLQKSFFPNRFDVRLSKTLLFAVDQLKGDFNIEDELMRHGVYPGTSNKSSQNPLDIYLSRHRMEPRNNENIAIFVLKLFFLKGNILSKRQIVSMCVYRESDVRKCLLEVSLMQTDEITTGISVYDIVSEHIGTNTHLSNEEYDTLLTILLTGKYPVYSDIIASCFSYMYMSEKFAEICSWVEINNVRSQFLIYDMRFWLSYYYLSQFDIFMMMFLWK